MLACSIAVFGLVSSAGATTPSMTVTIGSPIKVTDRLLVSVPVSVVCAPIGNPGDTTLTDSVTVSISQAHGKTVSSGSATMSAGPFSPQNPTSPGFLTCDGTTVNSVTVQILGNGVFRAGGAIVSASALHTVGSCNGFCSSDGSESVSVGPMGVRFK